MNISDEIRTIIREELAAALAPLELQLQAHASARPLESPSDLLTAPEAARYARRHAVTVRHALEAGELHGAQPRPGAHWTVRRSCLAAWLAGERCADR